MNKFSLKFNNQLQELQYQEYIAQERGGPLKLIVCLQSFNEFIILSSSFYYYIIGKDKFQNSEGFLIFQVCFFSISLLLAILIALKILRFNYGLVCFVLLQLTRLALIMKISSFLQYQLQYFTPIQLGYGWSLISVVAGFSHSFLFKVLSVFLLGILIFFLNDQNYNNIYTMTFMTAIFCYKVFSNEKNIRQDFLVRQKLEKWMLIIDKIIPSCIFISKFNPREETIELQLANHRSRKQFAVKNSDQFNSLINNVFLDKSKDSLTLSPQTSTPPNNLKTLIRTLIEKEKTATKENTSKRTLSSRSSYLGNLPILPLIKTSHNHLAQSSARKISLRSDGFSNNSSTKKKERKSLTNDFTQSPTIKISASLSGFSRQSFLKRKYGKRQNTSFKSQMAIPISETPNQVFSPSYSVNQSMQEELEEFKKRKDHNSRKAEAAVNQTQAGLVETASPLKNRERRKKQKGNMITKNEQISNIAQYESKQTNSKGSHVGYYLKDSQTEQKFDIKLFSFSLDEIYVIIVMEEGQFKEKEIKDKHKLKEYLAASNKFSSELNVMARKMFFDLRNQQIQYLNEKVSKKLKSQNMGALSSCFGIINFIDNHLASSDHLSQFISMDEIKEVKFEQIFNNLSHLFRTPREKKHIKWAVFNHAKEKTICSSSKHLTQLLYNVLNLSIQLCAEHGLVQIEIQEKKQNQLSDYLEVSVRHSLSKHQTFNLSHLNNKQRDIFETSKKLLELISPFSNFFIKQRTSLYAQIKFFIYSDLNDINILTRNRMTVYSQTQPSNGNQELIQEEEELFSDELSLLEQIDPSIPPVMESSIPNQNSKNQGAVKGQCNIQERQGIEQEEDAKELENKTQDDEEESQINDEFCKPTLNKSKPQFLENTVKSKETTIKTKPDILAEMQLLDYQSQYFDSACLTNQDWTQTESSKMTQQNDNSEWNTCRDEVESVSKFTRIRDFHLHNLPFNNQHTTKLSRHSSKHRKKSLRTIDKNDQLVYLDNIIEQGLEQSDINQVLSQEQSKM